MFKYTEAEKRVLALIRKKAKKENPFRFAIPNELKRLGIKSDTVVKCALRIFEAQGIIERDTTSRKNPVIKLLV